MSSTPPSWEIERHLLKNTLLECEKVNLLKRDFSLFIKKGIKLNTINNLAEKICIDCCSPSWATRIIKRWISNGILDKQEGFIYVFPEKITEYYEEKDDCAKIILSGKYNITNFK